LYLCLPLLYGASLAAERGSDAELLAGVGLVGAGVASVVNLLEGLTGSTIELELKDAIFGQLMGIVVIVYNP